MAKHTISRILTPPTWALKLDLVVSPFVTVMMLVLMALSIGRGEYTLALRCLSLACLITVGTLYSAKMLLRRRRAARR